MKQGTVLSQKQTLKFSPQQVLVATMVQATTEELESLIVAETEKNPVLETSDEFASQESYDSEEGSAPDNDDVQGDEENSSREDDNSLNEEDYRKENVDVDYFEYDDNSPSDNSGRQEESSWSPFTNYASDTTSIEELHRQIDEQELDDEESYLAHYIVDSLDDNGYLRRSLQQLCDDILITQNHETTPEALEEVLTQVVQGLEPTGIGARDLRECMLLQLEEMKGRPAVRLAYEMVDKYSDDIFKKSFDRIKSRLSITDKELADAMRVIAHINPKPGGMSQSADRMESRAAQIKPDFSIHEEDGELIVHLLDGRLPAVQISAEYQQMLEQWEGDKNLKEEEKKGATFLRESISSASGFIEALKQRHMTLLAVIKVIAAMQRDYFLSGGNPAMLKPMVLQDVSERAGYDMSTISRVSNSKYIDTDFGIISVKELFSNGMANEDGEMISTEEIKSTLKQVIEEEDKSKPLADEALMQILNEKGYPVARRTVAKYREQLGYPTARMRKEI